MPAPIPFKTTLMFAPQEIGHITEFPVYDSRQAGMHTPRQLKAFWVNVIHNTASISILKKICSLKWAHGLCKFRRFNRRNGLKTKSVSIFSAFTGIFHKKFHRNIRFCHFFSQRKSEFISPVFFFSNSC